MGNLKGVQTPTLNITYKLDGLGRRYSRSVNGTITQYFIYDEDNRLIAELDPTGVIDKHNVYTSKSHVPDLMIKSGVSYRIISDDLGSVRFVVNSVTGQVMQKLQYDDFGKVLVDTNPGYQSFGYAGGIYDKDTSLTLFGVRSYDSSVGRWISKDPILFDGGDVNLFGYVQNDPVNWIDPSGLARCLYNRSSHTMTCVSNDGQRNYSSSNFVSGNGPGRDAPGADVVGHIGPIPSGSYSVGGYVRPGSTRRSLTPMGDTNTYGRSAFQTHGCGDKNTCSEGCVASPDIKKFNEFLDLDGNDNILYVH